MTDEPQVPSQRDVPISAEAAEAAERLMARRNHAQQEFAAADEAARQFVQGLALGLGLALAQVAGIDTDRRVLFVLDEPEQPSAD